MGWIAKATGNMTLSVLDENGFQILKVDMLSAGTLKAGTHGANYFRTMNDLYVIAHFSESDYEISDRNLKYPKGGLSPYPWSVNYDNSKRRLTVKSGNRKIAYRDYPRSVSAEYIINVKECIEKGVRIINQLLQYNDRDTE